MFKVLASVFKMCVDLNINRIIENKIYRCKTINFPDNMKY